jgi:hypothetical protein
MGGRGHLEAVTACWWKQKQHDVAHLLHIDFTLPNADCFNNDVAVARSFAQLHHLVRVLSESLSEEG